jgi:hypothetical protein
MPDCKIEEYYFVEALGAGVRSDLFWFGLIPAAAVFLLFSLIEFFDYGSREFSHLLPWYIVFSLLIAIFVGGLMTETSVRKRLAEIGKAKQCDRELTIWFSSSLKD